MQFWKIEVLKRRLASGAVSQRELFLYLLVWVALDAIIMAVDMGDPNTWDLVSPIFSIFIVVLGTAYAFYENGGGAGLDFLPRYISLSWVLAVRFLALVLVPSMIGYILAYELVSEVPEGTTAADTLLFAVLEVAFYWRLGHHIHQIACSGEAA